MQEYLNTIIEILFFPSNILLSIVCLFILINSYYILYINLHTVFFKECNLPISSMFTDEYFSMHGHWFVIFICSITIILIMYLDATIMIIEGITLNIFLAINWVIISGIFLIIGIQLIWNGLNCLFEHLTKSINNK